MLNKASYKHVGRSAGQTSVWVHKKCTCSSEDFAADWSVTQTQFTQSSLKDEACKGDGGPPPPPQCFGFSGDLAVAEG